MEKISSGAEMPQSTSTLRNATGAEPRLRTSFRHATKLRDIGWPFLMRVFIVAYDTTKPTQMTIAASAKPTMAEVHVLSS